MRPSPYLGGGNFVNAQTDVTSTYLTNAGFDDGETGWTFNGSGTTYHGVAAYGSSTAINSATNINVDKFGKNTGNAAFSNAGWGDKSYYTQEVTLPAGNYKLTFDVINRFSDKTSINENYFGWVPNSGTAVYSTTKTFEYNVWYTLSVTFTLSESTTGKISCGMKSTSGSGSGAVAKLFIDNVKIFKMDETGAPTTANPIDYSDLINQTTWSVQQDDNATPITSSTLVTNITSGDWTGKYVERYRGVAGHYGKALYQTVFVPAGVYQVQAACMSSCANNVDPGHADGDLDVAYFYANSEELTYPLSDKKGYYRKHIVTLDADGTIEFGINTKVVGANWNAIGCATLVKVANSEEEYLAEVLSTQMADFAAVKATAAALLEYSEYVNVTGTERTELTTQSTATVSENTVEAYETAIAAVQSAIDAFTAAKANYDALAHEITKAAALGFDASEYAATSSSTAASALTATQGIKVAEYNLVNNTYQYGVELGTWTTTGPTGSLSDQHYKGSGNSYLEQSSSAWGSSSWTIKYDQNLTLPAGNYVFKVAGRQADSDGVTLSLTVKQGETVLGTVNDFPRGDTGLGINTSGATDFTTGEGHEYVNGGAGRGWEWRYVKFTLSEDATVNVAVDAVATTSHMWVSFCDATVQTDNEANISLIAYNVALESAQTTIANTDYENITGSEKTTLQNAIDADATLDKTDNDAIVAATTALDEAREAFVAAKSAYDAFVAAKTKTYENNLPYASSTKFAAIATAQGAADATSADDATTKTNAIISAYRKYVESNAMAEGVTSAEDKTSLIGDPNFAGVTISGTTAGAWAFDQTGGSANINSNEPFTDGDGNSNYSYFDYYNGSNNNQNLHQVIENLEPGRYILTVTARGHSNFNGNLQLYVVGKGSINIPAIGNSGGDFDRGWNDVTLEFTQIETSNITIGVKTNNSKAQWWGVTRFRLVKLSDVISENATTAPKPSENANVILYRTLSSGYWNTFSVPFNMEKPDGWEVKEFDSATDNVINFKDAESIVAGNPYLVKPASDVTEPMVFNGVTVSSEAVTKGEGNYKFAAQLFHDKSLPTDGTIAYLATDGTIKKLTSGSIKGLRAYFIIPAGGEARIAFTDGDQTGINDTVREATNDNRVYDLQGRQVKAVKKGIYVVNGKKVIK